MHDDIIVLASASAATITMMSSCAVDEYYSENI